MSKVQVLSVARSRQPGQSAQVQLNTSAGAIHGRLQEAAGDAAILWVFGGGGGLSGPAGGVYFRLGRQLYPRGITSLELDYRHPGSLQECVLDVRLGIEYLMKQGKRRIVLVGHSFGGAVVITAGAGSDAVVAVAALSSQSSGTASVQALSPRPLLLIHGTADDVVPDLCSRDIYRRAKEPKRLILYPACRHGLDECREALDRDLRQWLEDVLLVEAQPHMIAPS